MIDVSPTMMTRLTDGEVDAEFERIAALPDHPREVLEAIAHARAGAFAAHRDRLRAIHMSISMEGRR